MKCPDCKTKMVVRVIQTRNCQRYEYLCPDCEEKDFDFQNIVPMSSRGGYGDDLIITPSKLYSAGGIGSKRAQIWRKNRKIQ
jgi:transposase-like protein